jgi:hypothetical protein
MLVAHFGPLYTGVQDVTRKPMTFQPYPKVVRWKFINRICGPRLSTVMCHRPVFLCNVVLHSTHDNELC